MTVGTFSVNFESTTVVFDKFSGEDLPRSFLEQATLEFSALGVAYSTGSTKRQKRIWSIAAYASQAEWQSLLDIFTGWDNLRASGSNLARVNIVDSLLGSTITAEGFFTSPPSISKIAPGNNTLFLVTFAITEV